MVADSRIFSANKEELCPLSPSLLSRVACDHYQLQRALCRKYISEIFEPQIQFTFFFYLDVVKFNFAQSPGCIRNRFSVFVEYIPTRQNEKHRLEWPPTSESQKKIEWEHGLERF